MPQENGKITVTTQRVIKGIEIIIEDNGKGIDQESLPRIFDPFLLQRIQVRD